MTRFDLRQRVQTRSRRVVPFTTARTRWRLGYQRRFVLLFAWLTLCPVTGHNASRSEEHTSELQAPGHHGCRPRPENKKSEEHTSELQSPVRIVCRLLL